MELKQPINQVYSREVILDCPGGPSVIIRVLKMEERDRREDQSDTM